MRCKCKRIRNFDELSQEIKNNNRVIKVSKWMKFQIFLKYLLFTFKNVLIFGYNLFRYDNLREWINL